MDSFIYHVFLDELEILKKQNLPKYPNVINWLKNNTQNIKENRIKSFCSHLRNSFVKTCVEFEDNITSNDEDASPDYDLFLTFMKHCTSSILESIIICFEDFSKTQTDNLFYTISLEFKTILVSSLLRILKQFNPINTSTYSQFNNFLLVSTMDGKLNIVNNFYGIVVFSVKTGPPLFYSNQSLFSVTHNSKSIRLIPSLQGSLYRWNFNHHAEPLYLSIEKLLSNNIHTSNVLFTGCKKTYIKSMTENLKDDELNMEKARLELNKNIREPNFLIKRTSQTLYAHDRNNHKKLWNFCVSEIDLIPKRMEEEIPPKRLLGIHHFKINAQKGEIYRLADYKISNTSCLWKLKLKSPIANAWLYKDKELQQFDLFAYPNVDLIDKNTPKFFISCHKNQKIYIRESSEFQKESSNLKTQFIDAIFNEKLPDDEFMLKRKGHDFYVYRQNEIEFENENEENISQNAVEYNSHFENNFEFIKILGRGGFGIVLEALHKHDKCNYAIKRIKLQNVKLIHEIQREVIAQANLKHDNVVNYHNSWLEEPPLDWDDPLESKFDEEQDSSTEYSTSYESNLSAIFYIQMQLCKGGNLGEWLKNNQCPDERKKQFKNIFKQIVNGVEYIHKQNLIHRDLKPQNIFFFSETHVKIGDFGLVTDISEPVIDTPIREKYFLFKYIEHTPNVGTSLYMAPEQKNIMKYNYKVDIWSLAIIRVELLIVFKTDIEKFKTLEKLHIGIYPQYLIDELPDECKVLNLMLKENPKERLCTYGIRAHSPFNDVVDEHHYFNLPK